MMTTRRQSLVAHGILLATVMVWGATFSTVKSALRDCTPLLFNQLRMILAFVALAILHHREWRQMKRGAFFSGAIAGLFMAAGYELQTTGLVYTTAPRSAFLTGLVVILVPIACIVPALRPPGAGRPGIIPFAGAIGAFVGLVLLTTPAGTPLTEFTRGINRGDIFSFFCAIAFAAHLLSLSHLARKIPTSHLATLQIGFCALFMSIATPAVEHTRLHWTPNLVFALIVCALLATAAAFSAQSWAQQHMPASRAALFLALEPAFALVTALVFFGERLTARSATGAALILLSLLAGELLSSPSVSEQPEANMPVNS